MKHYAFVIFALAMICLNKCHSYYCVVKGSVRGIEDGATIQMLDAWDHYAKLDSVIVENGPLRFVLTYRPRPVCFSTKGTNN